MSGSLQVGRGLSRLVVLGLLLVGLGSHALSPPLTPPTWLRVSILAIVGLHFYKGYRGARWVFGGLALWLGGSLAYRLMGQGMGSSWNTLRLALLTLVCLGAAGVLFRSRSIATFVEQERLTRRSETGLLVTALWIVLLAALAVWLWVLAGLEVGIIQG